ncbi:hypothetical protein D3C77_392190 [compost metagenome]
MQSNILSKIIQGIRGSITSWTTKLKEKRALSAKRNNKFSLTFTKDVNKIIVHEGLIYRVFVSEDDITVMDQYDATVKDYDLIVALLEYFKENMQCPKK